MIKSHNPESDVDSPDNILKIILNAISELNVNMARISFKQMYVTFDNDLEKAWKYMLVIGADEYSANHNGDQPILIVDKSAESNGSGHEGRSYDNSKESYSQ